MIKFYRAMDLKKNKYYKNHLIISLLLHYLRGLVQVKKK